MAEKGKTLRGKVGGKFSSAAKHADMLGAVLGYFGTFAAVGKEENVSFIQEIMYRHVNAVTIHNVGKLSTDYIPSLVGASPGTETAGGAWSNLFRLGVAGLISGAIVGMLPSVVPWQKSAASIVKRGGFGLAVGTALAVAVGKLAEGSGGGTELGGQSSGSSSGGSISTTGMKQGVLGSFAPPAPYAGAWARPS